MSRLLFAAARGARIQRQHFKDHPNNWEAERIVRLGDHDKIGSDYVWRIHPDDSHLGYGPISTVLRERAGLADRNTLALVALEAGSYIIYDEYYYQYINCDHRTTRQTYLLLMAEALADEGL